METLTLSISTPEKVFYDGPAEQVILSSTEGEMGVLPHHVLMVVALETAPIHIKTENGWRQAALSGGFAQITGSHVVILADTAEWPEEIEINRAIQAKRRAQERLHAHRNEIEYMQSQVALKRAIMRLQVVNQK